MKNGKTGAGLTAAKYIALTIAGIVLFWISSRAAYSERGYMAIGGEVLLLALPGIWWIAETTVGDMIRESRNSRRGRGNPHKERVMAAAVTAVSGILILTAVLGAAMAKHEKSAEAPELPPVRAYAHQTNIGHPAKLSAATEPQEAPESGFVEYHIPVEYAREGGYFPAAIQLHAYRESVEKGMDYAVVVAAIETESGYHSGSIGNDGDTGYLQIIRAFHADRMKRLGVTDLGDPYQNITVGIDYMAELLTAYDGNYEKALTAYNCGPTGAYKYYFSAGVEANSYAQTVLAKAERIRAELTAEGWKGGAA